ncbi:MAG: hypothetical protein AAF688_02290 [Bacteroidota bacterium]
MKYSVFLFFICALASSLASAQSKDEKEERVSRADFPVEAKKLCRNIPEDAKRIRFYKETDGDKISYETKYKYNKHWYSVEFDSLGTLEDIEIKIKTNEIPKKSQSRIIAYFEENSEKFDIIKIQEQYLYDRKTANLDFLLNVISKRKTLNPNYEIIVALKVGKIWELKELTFTHSGTYLSQRTIKPNSYEYIMY